MQWIVGKTNVYNISSIKSFAYVCIGYDDQFNPFQYKTVKLMPNCTNLSIACHVTIVDYFKLNANGQTQKCNTTNVNCSIQLQFCISSSVDWQPSCRHSFDWYKTFVLFSLFISFFSYFSLLFYSLCQWLCKTIKITINKNKNENKTNNKYNVHFRW